MGFIKASIFSSFQNRLETNLPPLLSLHRLVNPSHKLGFIASVSISDLPFSRIWSGLLIYSAYPDNLGVVRTTTVDTTSIPWYFTTSYHTAHYLRTRRHQPLLLTKAVFDCVSRHRDTRSSILRARRNDEFAVVATGTGLRSLLLHPQLLSRLLHQLCHVTRPGLPPSYLPSLAYQSTVYPSALRSLFQDQTSPPTSTPPRLPSTTQLPGRTSST